MKLKDLYAGLQNGTIKVDNKGHLLHQSIIDRVEYQVEIWEKAVKEYQDKINAGEIQTKGKDKPNQYYVDLFQRNLDEELEYGRFLFCMEASCYDCGARMYIILIDETTITVVKTHDYWDISDKSGKKYEYQFKLEDAPFCPANHIREAGKLVSQIEVPTGQLIFRNYFDKEEIYDPKEEYYDQYSVSSILGRSNMMKYLGTQNVGYGQMGNMSMNVYSNGFDEIIIGDNIEYIDERYYSDEQIEKDKLTNSKYWTEEKITEHRKNRKAGEDFVKLIKEGDFKNKGEISLSVWRWMCADKSVLKAFGEPLKLKDEYTVNVKVSKGTWEIEHYYDFPKNGDHLYSRLKLVK